MLGAQFYNTFCGEEVTPKIRFLLAKTAGKPGFFESGGIISKVIPQFKSLGNFTDEAWYSEFWDHKEDLLAKAGLPFKYQDYLDYREKKRVELKKPNFTCLADHYFLDIYCNKGKNREELEKILDGINNEAENLAQSNKENFNVNYYPQTGRFSAVAFVIGDYDLNADNMGLVPETDKAYTTYEYKVAKVDHGHAFEGNFQVHNNLSNRYLWDNCCKLLMPVGYMLIPPFIEDFEKTINEMTDDVLTDCMNKGFNQLNNKALEDIIPKEDRIKKLKEDLISILKDRKRLALDFIHLLKIQKAIQSGNIEEFRTELQKTWHFPQHYISNYANHDVDRSAELEYIKFYSDFSDNNRENQFTLGEMIELKAPNKQEMQQVYQAFLDSNKSLLAESQTNIHLSI